MEAAYYLNGVKIKSPHHFKISRFKLSNLQRTADGTMKGDLIAKKRKFYFTYDAIDSVELEKIFDILWEIDEMFFTLKIVENNVEKEFSVYPGEIPYELVRTGSKWVWKGVTFDLIEQ